MAQPDFRKVDIFGGQYLPEHEVSERGGPRRRPSCRRHRRRLAGTISGCRRPPGTCTSESSSPLRLGAANAVPNRRPPRRARFAAYLGALRAAGKRPSTIARVRSALMVAHDLAFAAAREAGHDVPPNPAREIVVRAKPPPQGRDGRKRAVTIGSA